MDFLTIWSFLGFLFAVYAVTANDSIQTLGTYIASNRADVKWYWMFAYMGSIFVLTMIQGFNAGDPAFGRLTEFPEIEIMWYHALAPLVNLRVGAEWSQLDDSGLLDGNYNNNLTSVYCNYVYKNKQTLIVKYDMVSGNKDANYALLGIEFAPTKGLMVSPNVRSNDGTTAIGVNFEFQF